MTAETLALCQEYVALEQRIDACQELEQKIGLCNESTDVRARLNALFETHMGIKDMETRCRSIIASCEMLQAGERD